MKLAPNLLTNKFSLCKSARQRRGAAYFDLATELMEQIGVASARGCTQQFSAEYQCRTTQIIYATAMF
jgi:hypothetical protein